jgi:hypothetical protein
MGRGTQEEKWRMPTIENLPPGQLKPWPRNARTHSKQQVQQIARSIERFGFTQPVLIDEDNHILAGHGRVRAAQQLNLADVPCLRFSTLNRLEKRAYVLADNKLALNAGWDKRLLAEELKDLVAPEISFDVTVTGFSLADTQKLIAAPEARKKAPAVNKESPDAAPARCKPGDVFQLGPHWLICGDRIPDDVWAKLPKGATPKLLITVWDDEGKLPPEAAAEWAAATLTAANPMGASVVLMEEDAARCDRIIRRWEARTEGTAFWIHPKTEGEATTKETRR